MPRNLLFLPVHEELQTDALHDQIHMALAIADATVLKSLLIHCIPTITQPHLVDRLSAQIGVPTDDGQSVDAVLNFDAIRYTQTSPDPPPSSVTTGRSYTSQRDNQMAWQSELQTLIDGSSRLQSKQILASEGFTEHQSEEILRLPNDAWHKSWWCALDGEDEPADRFLRLIRTRRYPNGTLMIQYKDCFQKEQPACFRSQPQQVIVTIKSEHQGFVETLKQINHNRQRLGIQRVILLCNALSDIEVQGFINQGVNLYPMADVILPLQADCQHCASIDCVMNGREQSPVVICRNFQQWDYRV